VDNRLLVGLSRQLVLQRKLDAVANNLANLGTNGFKTEGLAFQEFVSGSTAADRTGSARGLSFVEDRGGFTDFSKGPIEQTGNPLDVAIDGPGFLVIQTANGERYTRNGALKLDAKGTLVANDGNPALTTSGPVSFTAQDGAITIGPDGTITTDQGTRGRLRVTQFAQPQTLRREGANLYASDLPGTDLDATATRLVPNAIEKSNVQPIVETTRLIEITRAYQAISSLMQQTQDLRKSAIERLGDISA